MTKAGAELRADLVGQREFGWELQLVRDGELFYGRRYPTHAMALEEAAACRGQ